MTFAIRQEILRTQIDMAAGTVAEAKSLRTVAAVADAVVAVVIVVAAAADSWDYLHLDFDSASAQPPVVGKLAFHPVAQLQWRLLRCLAQAWEVILRTPRRKDWALVEDLAKALAACWKW